MVTERDWAQGYLSQARTDLAAAAVLAERGGAASVLAMLLQMVFEKLAKAALLRIGSVPLSRALTSHKAASIWVNAMKRNRSLLPEPHAWKDVLPLVQELERAHPSVAQGGPQLEYPWHDRAQDEVAWPAAHLPIAQRLGDPRSPSAARALRFAHYLSEKFDILFP